MDDKVVHIVGPTGVGKTELAVHLAKKFNGQLISADSVQVYKNLDIISGKDIPKESKFKVFTSFESEFRLGYYNFSKIPIFLLDVVSPTSPFSVSDFKNLALKFIDHIQNQKKLPLVVGGTGFYIDSLTRGIETINIPPDPRLRGRLEKLSIISLKSKLQKLNPSKFSEMNNSDINNRRRLIRAIEISLNNNKNPKTINKQYSHLQIGLTAPRDFLKEKINLRVDKRLKNGALKEAESLFENYDKLCQQVKDANGYKQLFSYLKKEITLDEAIYRWKTSEYRHAKNQMTWFGKIEDIKWFDISKPDYRQKIKKETASHLAINQ